MFMQRFLTAFLLLFVCVHPLWAQGTVSADRFLLTTGPCVVRSGSGTPEGSVNGNVCDIYVNTATGVVYVKWSGTGNTGWGVGHNATAEINGSFDVSGDTTLGGNTGTTTYASQTTGWRITTTGAADFRYLYADELRIKLFSAEEQAVYRASLMVTPSHSEVSQAFTCPAASATSTLWVRDAATLGDARVFALNHWVVIRNFARTDADADGNQELAVGDCVGQVSAYADGSGANAGQQSWTFTRGSAGNDGSMASSTVVPVGAAVLDFGVSGNGAIELNAYDGAEGVNAPWIQTKRWSTSPVAANFTVTSRLGNLLGLTGVSNEFGLLAGTYSATNGTYFRASNAAFELHGIDLSLWQGATKTFFVDHAVPSLALGAAVPSAYGTGTGIWMGNDGGTYKFRVGNPAGNRVTWDGTTLSVVGDGSGITSINGGNITTGTVTATQIAADTITASQIAADAITTSELAADSVTSAKIVAGTIVASDIAASTITADRLSVATLSAITANLGTVTAGSISGVTATFGSNVTLDSSGITINSGSGSTNQLKYSDGSSVYSVTDELFLDSDATITLTNPSGGARLTGNAWQPNSASGTDLGSSGTRWATAWVNGDIDTNAAVILNGDLFVSGGNIVWSSAPTTAAQYYPVVFNTGDNIVYRKTDGYSGTCNSPTSIVIELGIVVGCS